MKKKIIALLCMTALTVVLAAGCGSSEAETESTQETTVETQDDAGEEDVSEPEPVAEEEASQEEAPESAPEEEEPAIVLEDGIYTVDFDTDSSMFHVNEACDGKGTLTVEDGQMILHVSLVSKNIENLFVGLAEDAQKDGAEILQPTVDAVTYSDGITEEVYGFDIPVPVLEKEFDVAIIGKKGKWYDHKVSVSNPEKAE